MRHHGGLRYLLHTIYWEGETIDILHRDKIKINEEKNAWTFPPPPPQYQTLEQMQPNQISPPLPPSYHLYSWLVLLETGTIRPCSPPPGEHVLLHILV